MKLTRTALHSTAAGLTLVAALGLTACDDDDSSGKSAPSPAPTASSASSSAGGSGTGGSDQGGEKDSAGTASAGKGSGGKGTAAGTGSDESGKVGKCRTAQLKITATDTTITGDPDGTVTVQLKNNGGRDCAISGYAGVDLKTSSGSLSAKRTGEPVNSIVLKAGRSTAFGVNYPLNDSGGSGVRVTALLVTPPNETKTVTLHWPGATTLPVTDGTGAPVKVGPVGSAGQGG